MAYISAGTLLYLALAHNVDGLQPSTRATQPVNWNFSSSFGNTSAGIVALGAVDSTSVVGIHASSSEIASSASTASHDRASNEDRALALVEKPKIANVQCNPHAEHWYLPPMTGPAQQRLLYACLVILCGILTLFPSWKYRSKLPPCEIRGIQVSKIVAVVYCCVLFAAVHYCIVSAIAIRWKREHYVATYTLSLDSDCWTFDNPISQFWKETYTSKRVMEMSQLACDNYTAVRWGEPQTWGECGSLVLESEVNDTYVKGFFVLQMPGAASHDGVHLAQQGAIAGTRIDRNSRSEKLVAPLEGENRSVALLASVIDSNSSVVTGADVEIGVAQSVLEEHGVTFASTMMTVLADEIYTTNSTPVGAVRLREDRTVLDCTYKLITFADGHLDGLGLVIKDDQFASPVKILQDQRPASMKRDVLQNDTIAVALEDALEKDGRISYKGDGHRVVAQCLQVAVKK